MQDLFNNTEVFIRSVLIINFLLAVVWAQKKLIDLSIKLILWFISGWAFYLLIK